MIRTLTATGFAATLALGLSVLVAPQAASAQECASETDPWDMTDDEVLEIYACIGDAMVAGYTSGDDAVAPVYRDWTATATRPGLAGPHGERFLNTFVNDIAAEQYLQFAFGEFEMPVGSVLAKESFKVSKGTAKVGPLFIMTKVAAGGEAAEFDNWVYSAVQPGGKPMKISQKFCHDCHGAFADQDSMGYPLEEVRLSTGG